MKNLCLKEWAFFKTNLFIRFGWLLILSAFLAGLFYFYFSNAPAAQERALKIILRAFQEEGFIGPAAKNPLMLALKIFYNNLRVLFVFTVLGFIPYFIGTAVFLFSLPVLLGLTLAATISKGFGFLTFLKLTAPHGIFELFAVFYGVSLGVYLSKEITKKILLRHKHDSIPFADLIKQIIRSFSLVIIPFLALAAVIETFIMTLFR